MAFKSITWGVDNEYALVLGVAGAPPAATANDAADFMMIVPFNLTLLRLKATMKTAPSANLVVQVRRDTGSGFANAFGTVQINSAAVYGVSDPANLDVNEGDRLQFSITTGGGTGTNLALFIIGVRR